jgi:hypothetical protein
MDEARRRDELIKFVSQTSADRIAEGCRMWSYTRERLEASARWLYPEWSDLQVREEISIWLLKEQGIDFPLGGDYRPIGWDKSVETKSVQS